MDIFSSLGVNWSSVLMYLVNFGILFVVVSYFATGPLLKILDKRRKFISETIDEAEKLKSEISKVKEKSQSEKDKMQAELAEERDNLHKEVDEQRKDMTGKIEEKKSHMLSEARSIIGEEKGKLLESVEEEVLDLIEKVVLAVVSDKIPKDVVLTSIQEEWDKYKKN